MNWQDYYEQKEKEKNLKPPKRKRNYWVYFSIVLILFISISLIYAQVRYEDLQIKYQQLQTQQPPDIIREYLIVTAYEWGSWEKNNKTIVGIVKFSCNGSQIDPTLWVNGSAMTGIKVSYWWHIASVSLLNWTYGWI